MKKQLSVEERIKVLDRLFGYSKEEVQEAIQNRELDPKKIDYLNRDTMRKEEPLINPWNGFMFSEEEFPTKVPINYCITVTGSCSAPWPDWENGRGFSWDFSEELDEPEIDPYNYNPEDSMLEREISDSIKMEEFFDYFGIVSENLKDCIRHIVEYSDNKKVEIRPLIKPVVDLYREIEDTYDFLNDL